MQTALNHLNNKNHLHFGSVDELKNLVGRLNGHARWKYRLKRQKGIHWLIEEDLGDEYLNYAIIQVRGEKVWALSPDVMIFLNDMRKRAEKF